MSGGHFLGAALRDRICAFSNFEIQGASFTCKVNANEANDLPGRVRLANLPTGLIGVRVTKVGDRDPLGERPIAGDIAPINAP